MNKIRRMTTAELSADALREQILSRKILPGSRITEDAMARELGISRATVRQALSSLLLEGLLVRNPATRVLEVLSLDASDVAEIYRARRVLELAGVEASADASDEALLSLNHAVARMREAVERSDVPGFVEADAQCHARTVAFLNSHTLSEVHASLMGRLRLGMTHLEADGGTTSEGLAQHQEFSDLVMARDIQRAKEHLARRLNVAEQQMLDSLIAPPHHSAVDSDVAAAPPSVTN